MYRRLLHCLALTALSFVLVAAQGFRSRAGAESLICPGGIVSTGEHIYVIIKLCGEPLYREEWEEGSHHGPRVKMERLYYTINGWDREFEFRNGTLVDISY